MDSTKYPKMRRNAADCARVLMPAANNRKFGRRKAWAKGPHKGMPLYSLTLEEKATCDSSCPLRAVCYGQNMPFAYRFNVNAALYAKLDDELSVLARKHPQGVSVRLHVLGDFPSLVYVRFWSEMLAKYPTLHVWGYTHRRGEIRGLIDRTSELFGDRFVIRQSDAEPNESRPVANANDARFVTCPAQTGKTASCLTCGLCPNPNITGVSWLIH